jgi:hypothetical protein
MGQGRRQAASTGGPGGGEQRQDDLMCSMDGYDPVHFATVGRRLWHVHRRDRADSTQEGQRVLRLHDFHVIATGSNAHWPKLLILQSAHTTSGMRRRMCIAATPQSPNKAGLQTMLLLHQLHSHATMDAIFCSGCTSSVPHSVFAGFVQAPPLALSQRACMITEHRLPAASWRCRLPRES